MGFKAKVNGSIGAHKFLTKLTTNENIYYSDEPVKFGGENKGFNPLELLASSLAACTLATLKSYIDRRKWDIPKVNVEVELETFPKERKTVFKRYIDFENTYLTQQQKDKLFQIAEKCPIHNILTSKIDIFSELKSNNTEIM